MISETEGPENRFEVLFKHLKLGEGQKKKSLVIPGAKPLVLYTWRIKSTMAQVRTVIYCWNKMDGSIPSNQKNF